MMDVTMKNYEMLARFAGQDEEKLKIADDLSWDIESSLTRAQAKMLMSFDKLSYCYVPMTLVNYAVDLHEPIFIETAINVCKWIMITRRPLGNKERYTRMLCDAFQFLTDVSRREVLKNLDNAKDLYTLIETAIDEHRKVYFYALYDPRYVECMNVDTPYKAAWVIVNGKEGMSTVTDWEQFTLKQLKTVLKNVERIDRYAQIEHIEYDYSSGIAKEVKDMLDNCQIPDFTPIYFQKSEDMADEGEHMQNCIAGSWNAHTVDSFYCACIYQGVRMDIEIGKDSTTGIYVVYQLFEKSNAATIRTAELTTHINAALEAAWSTKHVDSIKVCVEYISACDDVCMVNASTGEVVVVDYEGVVIDDSEYIIGYNREERVVFRIPCDTRIELGLTLTLVNVTGTEEAGEALDELENIHNMLNARAYAEHKYDSFFDEVEDFDIDAYLASCDDDDDTLNNI